MIYLKLELFKYKRMMLNSIEHFKMDLTAPVQIILGTNGSGKSSLLQELSPLPASSNDFFKDGFKLIEISHNSKHYTLKSDFENGQHHSFICDGVELNPGGTVTVQRDLVKIHFSITSDIRELLISQSGFHKMSTSERRYWFTKLCDTNYDYAISVYNKIKERARDTSGALKLAKKRLGLETANLITEQEQKDIQNRCNDLLSFLDHLMQFRSNQNFNDDFDLKNQSRKNNELMTEIAQAIYKLKKSLLGTGSIVKQEEIVKAIVEHQTRYQLAKEKIDSLMQSFNALEEKVKIIKAQAGTDIESLQANLQILLDKQQLLKNQLVFDSYYDSPNTLLTTVNNLEDIIFNIFNQIDSNENNYYSRAQYEKDNAQFAKTQESITTNTNTLNKITAFITTQEEIRSHDKTECPNCNHKWNAGFDQINYDKAFIAKESIQSTLDELYTVSAEIKERMDKTLVYFNLLKDYRHLVQGYPQLSKMWQAIEADNNISLSPKTVTNKVQLFKKDLFTSVEITTLNEKIIELKTHIEIAEKVKQQDTTLTLKQRDELSEQITEQNNILTSTRQKITLLNKQNDLLNQINDLCIKLEKLIAVNESNCVKLVEYERVAAINDIIKSVQISLSKEQNILSDVKLQRALIEDLSNQITILEKQELAAKMLCSELSPIDGLIAEGMTGFIRSFVFQMNKIIKKVWLYPLEVLPCGVTDGESVELDYKFPMVIQNNHKDPTEDVSKGSSAMTEIIDLAFKIVAMKYLGLQGTPLMLDELGRAMDTEHKIKIIELIKQINDQHIFSQIFMISHDILHYGALSNTEICVLCDANILLPKGCVFNQHITIE